MNNLLTRTLLVGALSLSSLSAIANEKGNGGNAVVCFEDQNIVQELTKDDSLVVKYIPENFLNDIVSIEALDLYKAKLSSGMHNYKIGEIIDLEIDENVFEYGDRVLSKFKELYPGLIKAYSFGKKLIDRRIVEDFAPLVKVEDMRPISRVSEKCVVTTIMRQDWLPGSYSKKLSIDMRVFSHKSHSDLSKAVFFLHEYIYSFASIIGIDTSDQVHELVKYAITKSSFNVKDLDEVLINNGFIKSIGTVDIKTASKRYLPYEVKLLLEKLTKIDIDSKYFERSMYQRIPKFYKIYRETISKEVYKTLPRKFTQVQWKISELQSCSYALDKKQYAVMKELSKKNCKKANNLIDKLVSNFKKDLEIKLIPETKEKMLIELEQTITKLKINESSLFLESEIEQMNKDIKELILKEYMDLDQSIYEYRKMIFERHEIELN